MPQTLYGNQVGSETLRAGKAVTMTIVAGSGATVERIRNGSAVAADAISATTVFGPFTEDMVLRVSVNSGATLTIGDEADQIVQRPTDAKATAIDSLVSPDRISEALVAAYDAGMFALPAGTRLGTIAGVPTASILLDAGSGGTVTTARVTFAPPTDTIGAQRLLTPTAETYTLTMDSALVVTLGGLNGIALAMHAIGVSTDAVLTGESYVAESDYTLAEYIAGDARFEWLDSTPTRVRLTLQRGSSTRYATLSVVAEVSA